ncbi:MAG TPA: HAD family phosphatase [Thermoanaerobaculia bacterium]|nr:HAD family phosphatase [Thermoanaerobaculia bacterium]
MAEITWFIFDLGNTVIKLAYERVLENICKRAAITRDELVDLLEAPGAYRDMERGAVKFSEFYDFLCDKAGYRGTLRDLQDTWSDFFDGTLPGIEDLLDRLRQKYRIAFLSNSNEVHAEVIPRKFGSLFEKDDRIIFSHRFNTAKPDPEMFQRALEVVGALPHQAVLVDDLLENVLAARSVGMTAFQFRDSFVLERDLTDAGLL